MYCIEQGGASDRLCADETHAHLLQILCQPYSELGPLTEPDQKELIFRIGNVQEFASSLHRLPHLVPHAAACVQEETDRKRRVVIAEVRDLLLNAILEKPEFLFL